MLNQTKNNKTNWIDIVNPNQEDLGFLEENFQLSPAILAELVSPSSRTRVESDNDCFFIVYHLPIYDPENRSSLAAEIDFVAFKNTLITVRYNKIEPVESLFEKMAKEDKMAHLKNSRISPESLIYEILLESLNFSLRQLRHIEKKISAAGLEIFKKREKKMIEDIAYIKRDILNQRLIARPQKNILESLARKGAKFFGEKSSAYFNDLLGEHFKIWDTLDNFKETIESLEATNNTLFENKTSEVMRLLTIMAFFALPLSLLAGLFGMQTAYTPIVDNQYGFWIIVAIMVLISIGFYTFFKIKKWL